MELADILPEKAVIASAHVKNKAELLELLAQRTAEIAQVDAEAVRDALDQREQLGSTGLGNGIAIPHGKFAGLDHVVAVFARLDEPIEFDAVDDQPVDLVMMLLAPFGSGADHLKALARVARLLRTEMLVEDLRHTDDPHKIHGLLTAPLAAHHAA